jgi:hypothetical protein
MLATSSMLLVIMTTIVAASATATSTPSNSIIWESIIGSSTTTNALLGLIFACIAIGGLVWVVKLVISCRRQRAYVRADTCRDKAMAYDDIKVTATKSIV